MASLGVVRTTICSVLGASYSIRVFRSDSNNHFAVTRFGRNDVIITDGGTAEDALERHRCYLPLAVGSRLRKWEHHEEY